MLQLSVSSLVPDPRLSAEEAAPGQAACHCPPGRRFDWILISDSDQTARPMGRRRRANQAWAAQASLAAVWYRLIVTSRPRHSSQPGDAARVCGARAGCEAPPSGLRRVCGPGWWDSGQAWAEEPVTGACLESGAGSVTELKWAESSRARLDISRDHAISGTQCTAVGGDTNPGPPHRHHPAACEPTSGSEQRSDVTRDEMIWIKTSRAPNQHWTEVNWISSDFLWPWSTEDDFINVVSGEEHGQYDGVEPRRVHGPQRQQHLRSHGQ